MAELAIAEGDRIRAATRRVAARGVPGLASRCDAELRRPRRPDRGDAPHSGRGEALDFGEPFLARAQLLHAAARARGAAARDLYRLADAPHPRRHHGRRPLRAPRPRRHHGAQLRLCRLRQRAGDCGGVFRAQGRGARDRAGGGRPHRQALAQEQRDARARGGRICGHLLFQYSVPDHYFWRGADRLCRRFDRRRLISAQGRSWRWQARWRRGR